MKKTLAVLLAFLLIVTTVTGCGKIKNAYNSSSDISGADITVSNIEDSSLIESVSEPEDSEPTETITDIQQTQSTDAKSVQQTTSQASNTKTTKQTQPVQQDTQPVNTWTCPDPDAHHNYPASGNCLSQSDHEKLVEKSKAIDAENTSSTENQVSPAEYVDEVIRLVNEIRVQYGLSPLTKSPELCNVAGCKAQDMADNNYFSHTSPTYGSPFEMMKSFGITYRTAGENIAHGHITPQAVVDGWMNSSGHRANILHAAYTQIGVGYVPNKNYWVQTFIG